jgi:multidrug resistance efflux pump
MKPTPTEIRLERANRRIERRDRKIAGLQRKIEQLENALAWRTIDLESVTRNVHDAVQRALCNVRMIPIHGWTRDQVIAEVRTITTNPKQ